MIGPERLQGNEYPQVADRHHVEREAGRRCSRYTL